MNQLMAAENMEAWIVMLIDSQPLILSEGERITSPVRMLAKGRHRHGAWRGVEVNHERDWRGICARPTTRITRNQVRKLIDFDFCAEISKTSSKSLCERPLPLAAWDCLGVWVAARVDPR